MTLASEYKCVSRRPAGDGVGQNPVNGDTLSDEMLKYDDNIDPWIRD